MQADRTAMVAILVATVSCVFSGCQVATEGSTPTLSVETVDVSPVKLPGMEIYSGDMNSFNGVLTMSDGTLVTVGGTRSMASLSESWPDGIGPILMTTQPDGTSWFTKYDNDMGQSLSDLAETPEGDIIVVGSAYGLNGPDTQYGALVAEIDRTGTVVWKKLFGTSFDIFNSVIVGADGSIYVCGALKDTYGELHPSDIQAPASYKSTPVLVKFTSQGDLVWVKNLGLDNLSSVASSPDGDIVVAGTNPAATGQPVGCIRNSDCPTVIKVSSNGEIVWAQNFWSDDLNSMFIVTPSDVTVNANGDIYDIGAFGNSLTYGDVNAYAARFSADGAMMWLHTFPGSSDNHFRFYVFSAVAASPTSGVIIVGSGQTVGTSNFSALVASLDDDGSLVWYQGLGTDHFNRFSAVTFASDGSIAAVGYATQEQNGQPTLQSDAIFARLTADGSIR